jgi:hypothetical protein
MFRRPRGLYVGCLLRLPDGRLGRLAELDRDKNIARVVPLSRFALFIRACLGRRNRTVPTSGGRIARETLR